MWWALSCSRPPALTPILAYPSTLCPHTHMHAPKPTAHQGATLSSLASLYVDAPAFTAGGPPAHLALFRRRLTQDPGMTFVEWGNRAAARLSEIAAQQAQVLSTPLPIAGAPPATVGSVMSAYRAAGANSTWLPPADAAALGALGVDYNLASWSGGQYEFVSCDLPRRGAEYVGRCEVKPVLCSASAVDGVPYSCTVVADNTTVAGNLSSSAYREGCELPCDLELDCGALCDCGLSGCAAGEVRARCFWAGVGGRVE